MELTALFYEIDDKLCRKYLDIKTSGVSKAREPDIVFICLNPGSCDGQPGNEPVRVEPDPTILQLCNLIGHHDIQFIRLLNLTDYKDPKSENFFQWLKSGDFEKYSLFSPSRHKELDGLLPSNSKVIAAWGVNPENRSLTKMAMGYLETRQMSLLNHDFRPYHPLPRGAKRQQWVSGMKKLLSQRFS